MANRSEIRIFAFNSGAFTSSLPRKIRASLATGRSSIRVGLFGRIQLADAPRLASAVRQALWSRGGVEGSVDTGFPLEEPFSCGLTSACLYTL
jgi:hypothetical protein